MIGKTGSQLPHDRERLPELATSSSTSRTYQAVLDCEAIYLTLASPGSRDTALQVGQRLPTFNIGADFRPKYSNKDALLMNFQWTTRPS